MKTRLNITIEDTVLANIKSYAAARQISISKIIEDHLRTIATNREVVTLALTSPIDDIEDALQYRNAL